MKSLMMREIADAVGGSLTQGDADAVIDAVSQNSKTTGKGDIFFPIIGENHDGHRFIKDAFDRGCRSFIYSDEESVTWLRDKNDANLIEVEDTTLALGKLASYYLKALDIKTIGVTGSTGKTTTRDMVATVMRTKYKVGSTEGNFNNHIGLPLTILGFDEDVELAVLEMGMDKKGEIDYLVNIADPTIGIITNIGISHMENLGSRTGIFEAKMEITNRFTTEDVLIVYEGDFLTREGIAGEYRSIISGEDETCDIVMSDFIEKGAQGISFCLSEKEEGRKQAFSIPTPGKHNAKNASLAVAAGRVMGISMAEAAQALKGLIMTEGRLTMKDWQGVRIIDDTYNASPDSMKGAIEVLAQITDGKKIAVLGDMYELGNESKEHHKEIGIFAARSNIDKLYSFGDLAKDIYEGYESERGKEAGRHFQSKEELADALRAEAQRGDAILFKGSRGIKMETIIEDLMK